MTDPGAWTWMVAGLVLVGAELAVPGVFLLWLGLAALATGAADLAFGLAWQGAIGLFAVLSLVAVGIGRALAGPREPATAPLPHLSLRGQALVGQRFTLDRAIEGGEGRIRVGDSVWRVIGPALPVGTSVTVVRIDGATLVVAPTDAASRP